MPASGAFAKTRQPFWAPVLTAAVRGRGLGASLLRALTLTLALALQGGLGQAAPVLPPEAPTALLELSFSRLGAEEGLPGLSIFTTYQDRRGLIWIGTTNGLLRYDGRHFKTFGADPEKPDALDHPAVQVLLEDAGTDSMWVGTGGGLNQVDLRSDRLRRYAAPPELSARGQQVVGLLAAGERSLWVACLGGLYLFDKAQAEFRAWAPPRGTLNPALGHIRRMIGDGKGGLWMVQGHHALHVLADQSLAEVIDTRKGAGAEALSATELLPQQLVFDGQGRLWLGLAGGVQTWRLQPAGQAARPDPLAQSLKLPRTSVVQMLRDADNSIWLSLNGEGGAGLRRWREGSDKTQLFTHHDAVPSLSLIHI